MTKKLDSLEIDAYNCILHACHRGISLDDYFERLEDYAHKRLRMITGENKCKPE